MDSVPLKILTYNIHKGFSTGNRRFVLHQIREQLRHANVDVVFLQEIQGEHSVRRNQIHNWPTQSQFEFLADSIWSHYAYGKNAIYDSGHHGNAILSKFPFMRWDNINVSSMRSASRSLLHGEIRIGSRLLHVVCIHFDLIAYHRERQLKILSEYLAAQIPQDQPVIVAGDFNDWREDAGRFIAKELGLTEIFQHTTGRYARTFPSWLPMLPIDRIYYRGVKPMECARYNQAPWHQLSDHTPLYASFELENVKLPRSLQKEK
jgi:endonuclease/exonuclease/phosphatase family metal-dependent hydrolase